MEEVDEAEDEEEVVDVGWTVMRAGLWAAASAAATAGRMEGMSSGCRLGAGGLGGPGRDLAARRADLVGSGGGGRRWAVAFSFWAWLGPGPAMCEVVWVGVRGGEQFAWAAFRGRGGWAWVLWGVCGGLGRATRWGGRAAARQGPLGGCVWVVECGGRRRVSGGWVCGGRALVFGRVGEARVAGPGGARDAGRVWVSG